MSWFDNGEQSAALRYLNDFSGGGGGGLTFDPANPVFHGTGTTNAIVNTTCIGPQAQINISGDTAIGFSAISAAGGTAIGQSANSQGINAIAMQGGNAQGQDSFAAGTGAFAGDFSQAVGNSAQAPLFGQIAHGRSADCGLANSFASIALGDSARVGSNCGSSIAVGSSCQIGDDGGISTVVGAANLTQATSNNHTIFGQGNSINSGCGENIIVGNVNTVGSGSNTNRVIGSGNALADASVRNVLITDNFSNSGFPIEGCVLVGAGASTQNDQCTCVGATAQSTIFNGLALGAGAIAGAYAFQTSSSFAITADPAACFLGAGAVVANERLVININGSNFVIAVQKE